jgi:alkanesulfonate monooxygenase SsuD/methylene tetrahydromethanopterin reductase-like flavin-dependent oxidoreductase (luciferase family)
MFPRIGFGVLYDFRNPPSSGLSFPELYERTLDQIKLVDALGYDHVWLTEHHFVDDGYLPSPLVVSGAIAAVTKKVAIGQDVMLVPFHNPVRLAEDLAVLDNLSNGRMMLGAGMGYVPSEFAAIGVPRRERRVRMEETIQILQHAWTEEEFDFHGQRYQLEKVRVRPLPVQAGGPPLWIAAMSEGGARRAARFGAHLLPQGDRAAVLDPWLEALRAKSHNSRDYRVGLVRPFVVTDEESPADARARGAVTARLAAGERAPTYALEIYQKWFAEMPQGERMLTQIVEGAAAGRLLPQDTFIGTPAACIAEIEHMHAEYGLTDVIMYSRGIEPAQTLEAGTENLVRFAREVIPHFRQTGRT